MKEGISVNARDSGLQKWSGMILCTSRHILLDGITLACSPCFASLWARSVAA